MTKTEKNGLVPKLRFPEFRKSGEWEEITLGKICKFVRGPFGGALKKNIFVGDGYAVYEQSHAIHGDLKTFRYFITEEKYQELKRFAVKPNDLIMSCSGTMGKFAVIPQSLKEGVINQALLKLTVKTNFDLRFVKYTLEYPQNQEKLLSQSAGGAIKNVVGVGQLKEIKLFFPKEKEQQKIADCLSSLDELISSQAEKIESLKDHKKGLMQQLFPAKGQTTPTMRFPEFRNSGEWVSQTLSNIIELVSGFAFKSEYFSDNGRKLLIPKNFTKTGFAYFTPENTKFTTEECDEKYICVEGDLLLLLTDLTPSCELLGRPLLLRKDDGEVLLNQRIDKVIPKKEVLTEYLTYFFSTEEFRKRIINTATGSTVRHSSNAIVYATRMYLPELKEQQKIADCLSSLDDLIMSHIEKLENLKSHKKALMQQLFPSMDEINA